MHAHVSDLARIVVRPARPTDVGPLADLFDRLGPVTRYHRFPTPRPATVDHASTVATADGYSTGATVALVGDRIVGVAEWVSAPRSDLARFDVVVDDEWQRRSVGSLLVRRLAPDAARAGIRSSLTTVLASNHAAVAFARSLDRSALVSRLGTETTIVARVDRLGDATRPRRTVAAAR